MEKIGCLVFYFVLVLVTAKPTVAAGDKFYPVSKRQSESLFSLACVHTVLENMHALAKRPLSIADNAPLNPAAVLGRCTCDSNGNVYRAEGGCSRFAQFSNGFAGGVQRCPTGTLFNVLVCACDYASNVNCPPIC